MWTTISGIPHYWRLSTFYFVYYTLLGALVPYWGLYLYHQQYNAAEIGLLMAIPQLTKLGAPYLWGWLADKSGQRLRVIRVGNFFAALSFIGVFWANSFWQMAAVLLGFSFFWNAVMAQCEVVTLQALGEHSNRYSLVRLWGSIGFIISVIGLGVLLTVFPVLMLPWVLLTLLWLIWLASFLLPQQPQSSSQREEGPSIRALLLQANVWWFLLAAFLLQLSHGPYYTFYTLHLESLGFSRTSTGLLWALGVIAEVSLFLIMHRLLVRYPPKTILVASMALAAWRWLLIGSFSEHYSVLIFAQLLHAASFAAFHAAGIAWIHHTFVGRVAGQGQALFASLSVGAGWALGAVLAGQLWDVWGAHSFHWAALIALLAAGVVAVGVRNPHNLRS